MTDGAKLWVGGVLFTLALVWFLGIEVYCRWTLKELPWWFFWARLTAPLVASALMLVAFWLIYNTEAFRRKRGLGQNQAGVSWPSESRSPGSPTAAAGTRGTTRTWR